MSEKVSKIKISDPRNHALYNTENHALYNTETYPFMMSFVTSPAKGRALVYKFETCRDYMHEIVRCSVQAKGEDSGRYHHSYTKGEDPDVDMSKLRLVIKVHDSKKEALFSAKRLLNYYERMAGWKESKITTAEIANGRKDKVYLLTGPKQWMSHPSLISMVTLILRTGSRKGGFQGTTAKDVDKHFESIMASDSGDGLKIRDCHKKFALIMRKYTELFTGDLDKAYPSGDIPNFHSKGGIQSLCTYKSFDEELNTKLRTLASKEKLE